MKSKLLIIMAAAAVATVIALVVTLGGSQRTPNVSADPVSFDFDIIICDGVGGANDAACTDANTTADEDGGTGDGIIEPGDNPEVKTNLTLDTAPGLSDESFFALANTVWDGIAPTPGCGPDLICGNGDDIVDGDEVGEIYFTIESNLIAGLTSNVSAITGQPPGCRVGIATLSDTFKTYDAELDDTQTVSTLDTPPKNGLRQTEEDNFLADCSTAGSNGLVDGIDCVPQALKDTVIPNLGLGSPLSRSFGIANVAPALGVTQDVNFLVYDFDLDGDSTPESYVSVTLVGYPGGVADPPSAAGLTNQTVVTCPPFISNVRVYGISQGNDTDGDTVKDIPGGTVNRTVEALASGTYPYQIHLSSTDNYDGDGAASPFDTCDAVVSTDSDLPPAGSVDPDADRWDSACDPVPGSADNDGDGQTSPLFPVLNSWGPDAENCNQTGYGFAGGWDCDQDVDGDGQLNTVDNCPLVPSGDVDMDGMEDGSGPVTPGTGNCYDGLDNDLDGTPGIDIDEDGTPNVGAGNCADTIDNDSDTMVDANDPDCAASIDQGDPECAAFIDWQKDDDGDTVGDVCDPDPLVKGDGSGYSIDAHPHGMPGQPAGYHSHDDLCQDSFTVGAAEVTGGRVCASQDSGRAIVDSDNDGDPDWDDLNGDNAYQLGEPIDTDDDSDADTYTDACEAVCDSDPLELTSVPALATAGLDCDGDTTADDLEEKAGTDPFPAGCAGVAPPTPTTTPTPTETPILPTPTETPIPPTPGACTDRDGDTTCRDAANDTDDDGCDADWEAALGTSDSAWYDIFDVPAPAKADPTLNGPRSREVSIGDVLSVLFYAFADKDGPDNGNGVNYNSTKGMVAPHINPPLSLMVGMMYDRTPGDPDPDGAGPFINPAGPPNGVIDVGDVLIVLAQAYAVDCTVPAP